ncbi:MAG: flagellar export protein FliJ [Thiomicrorhabdus chilensis]|uniref:flagellar export protein FliJ n=1 Tax=Thiomicrorhabdus chilensis TaxID=63656 RepID=UPI00299F0839|nr:flagellar export protein FliJ [Thiomicrorhabdus chilensis]MDX1346926.1 flagellar export protein FliJ [Thiomicrorhabdus chilensis]
MKSRIDKIQTLVELARIEEDKSAKTVAELQGQHQQHLQQLDMLQSYVSEYSQATLSADRPVQPIQILSTQAFVAKLHSAIDAEQKQVDSLVEMVEQARQAWFSKRSRVKALEKLLQKIKQNKQAWLDKQEQHFLDELSSQNFNRKS